MARYVVLIPVRAGLAQEAEDWTWSSYWAKTEEETPDGFDGYPYPKCRIGRVRIIGFRAITLPCGGLVQQTFIRHAAHDV